MPLPSLPGRLQSLLLGGLSAFCQDSCSHPVSGVIRKATPLRWVQSPSAGLLSWATLTASSPTPPQTTKAPSGPAPLGSAWVLTPLRPGPSLSRPLQGLQELPPPRAGCLLSWGGPVLSDEASHTAQRPAPAFHPLRSAWALGGLRAQGGFKGPGWAQGPEWVQGPTVCLVLISSWRCLWGNYSVPATQRGHSFTCPSQEHRVPVGRLLPGYRAHLGRYLQGSAPRNRVQVPHCRASPAHQLVRL